MLRVCNNMASSSSSRVVGSQRVFIEAHRQSYVSQSGVIAVLEAVKKHGLPKHLSRQTLKRTRQDEIDCHSPMGELFTTISVKMQTGSFKEFPAINPLALLWLLLSTCSGFREYFSGVMAEHTPHPERMWRICVNGDDVLPGNALKVINERKLMSFYWGFLGIWTRAQLRAAVVSHFQSPHQSLKKR